MAVGSSARKGPPSTNGTSKSKSGSIFGISDSVYQQAIGSQDKKPVKKIRLKKSVVTQSEPGNWQTSKASVEKIKSANITVKGPDGKNIPLVTPVDPKIAVAFPSGKPFEEAADTVLCKHCRKPVYRAAAPAHIKECLKKKQEKLQRKKEAKEAKDAAARKERNGGVSPAPSVDDSGARNLGGGKKSAAKDADMDGGAKKTSKKRKADDEGKGPSAKKKKKDEPKAKTAKPKGPVDVEKQCGVLLPNGSQCARSLTCKSHSMGAKRAVPGRSMHYDVLLANYQKKNQAKLQRAAMDANAPLFDDFEQQGTVDSDEERDAVMAGINRYYRHDHYTGGGTMGQPLETWSHIPVRRRYNHIRLKGAIKHAIEGVHGSKLFATPATLNSGLFGGLSAETPLHENFEGNRSGNAMGIGRQIPPGSRKPSISG